MCVRWSRRLSQVDPAADVHVAPLAEGEPAFAPDALRRELHAVDSRGVVHRGYDAVVAIAAASPRLRWAARLLGARVVRPVGRAVYRVVARHRRRTGHAGS